MSHRWLHGQQPQLPHKTTADCPVTARCWENVVARQVYETYQLRNQAGLLLHGLVSGTTPTPSPKDACGTLNLNTPSEEEERKPANHLRAVEVAQWVKVPAAKPDDLKFPRSHVVERADAHTCAVARTTPPPPRINKIFKIEVTTSSRKGNGGGVGGCGHSSVTWGQGGWRNN